MSDCIKRSSQVEPSEESSKDVRVLADQDEHDLLEVEKQKLLWRLKVNEHKLDSDKLKINELKDKLVNSWRYVTWERASKDTKEADLARAKQDLKSDEDSCVGAKDTCIRLSRELRNVRVQCDLHLLWNLKCDGGDVALR
ncbi:hypothetical protein L1987_57338 [Smallanthus sonchifolius]|uniref:Uncharacterized protein n=1 Tax=Smallanthus sonchifolius TaxID=185202 RepID=A0ACB9DCS3_9ASTR|nr:hypothetical protein L1987_57338 [Smallanthus sonchifolius]